MSLARFLAVYTTMYAKCVWVCMSVRVSFYTFYAATRRTPWPAALLSFWANHHQRRFPGILRVFPACVRSFVRSRCCVITSKWQQMLVLRRVLAALLANAQFACRTANTMINNKQGVCGPFIMSAAWWFSLQLISENVPSSSSCCLKAAWKCVAKWNGSPCCCCWCCRCCSINFVGINQNSATSDEGRVQKFAWHAAQQQLPHTPTHTHANIHSL